MSQSKVLFIGRVWPEPHSSAAGIRILQLIDWFLEKECEVYFASAAMKTEFSFELNRKNVTEIQISLNSSEFNEIVSQIKPDLAIYDRYITEEQFGWRLRSECPDAIEILDTEDLHFLRFAREKAFKSNQKTDLYNEITHREIASVYRCDLSLIISEFEFELLTQTFNIPPELIFYLPLFNNSISPTKLIGFEERRDFVFIGNFLHSPNWHTVLELKNKIWPKIREQLPSVQLHIYGAYPSQKVFELNDSKTGFLIHGRVNDALKVIGQTRIMLAPIRFGAGVKGKLIDAMMAGTPFVTTKIGAESIFTDLIPEFIEDDDDRFIQKAVELYCNKQKWSETQHTGYEILNQKFDKQSYFIELGKRITKIKCQLEFHRRKNFIGQILKKDFQNALKYMSLWIEEKNKKNQNP